MTNKITLSRELVDSSVNGTDQEQGRARNKLRAALAEQPQADAEPGRNPVLAYADSYRAMARQGVETVSVWSVIADLERNIAPLCVEPTCGKCGKPTACGKPVCEACCYEPLPVSPAGE